MIALYGVLGYLACLLAIVFFLAHRIAFSSWPLSGFFYSEPFFNVSCRKVGGVRFLKVGRFFFSFGLSSSYRPIKGV